MTLHKLLSLLFVEDFDVGSRLGDSGHEACCLEPSLRTCSLDDSGVCRVVVPACDGDSERGAAVSVVVVIQLADDCADEFFPLVSSEYTVSGTAAAGHFNDGVVAESTDEPGVGGDALACEPLSNLGICESPLGVAQYLTDGGSLGNFCWADDSRTSTQPSW